MNEKAQDAYHVSNLNSVAHGQSARGIAGSILTLDDDFFFRTKQKEAASAPSIGNNVKLWLSATSCDSYHMTAMSNRHGSL